MASVKKTNNGNWYAVHEVTGKIINGQPQGGFSTRRGAKNWAVNNIDQVKKISQVNTY